MDVSSSSSAAPAPTGGSTSRFGWGGGRRGAPGGGRGFGWGGDRRGTPWLGHAIAGGAGALIAIGAISIGVDAYPNDSDDPGVVGALLCVALVVASFVAMARLPGTLRAAAVACIAIGIAGAFAFLFFPGINQVGDLRGFWLLTIAAWLLAFA